MIKIITIFLVFSVNLSLISAQDLKKLTIVITHFPENESSENDFFLAGDFNNWNPKNSSYQFQQSKSPRITTLLPAGIYNFKITRGSWESVESGKDGSDLNNHVVDFKNDTTIYIKIEGFKDQFYQTKLVSTASKNVQILDSAFFIPQLGVKRRIWVYLPKSYQTSKIKFPVIYMHDGQNLFDKLTSGYGEWGVDEVLDSISKVSQDEFIVVGIDHGGSERLSEYNPYNSKYGIGKGEKYIDFLVETLKPHIDKRFRTFKNRSNTTIAGSSMGGLISIYAAIKHQSTFGNIGVFSPAFWIAPQLDKDLIEAKMNKKTKFYFLAGEKESKDMVSDMRKIYDLLLTKGYSIENLKIQSKPDGQHNELFWRREFPDFIKFLVNN